MTSGVVKVASAGGPGVWTTRSIEPRGSFEEVGRFPDMVFDESSELASLVYLALRSDGSGVVRYAQGIDESYDAVDVVEVSDFSIGFSGARDLATLDLNASGEAIVATQTRSRMSVHRATLTEVTEVAAFEASSGTVFGQQTEVVVDGAGRIHLTWWQTGEAPGTICHAVRS